MTLEWISATTVVVGGLDNTWEVIGVDAVIARVEELEEKQRNRERWAAKGVGSSEGAPVGALDAEEAEELARHRDLLSRVRIEAGDVEWRGEQYPEQLIRDDYFIDNLKGDVDEFCHANTIANYIVIDWEMTAARVREDYQSIDIGGVRYWHLTMPMAKSVVYTDRGAYQGIDLDWGD
jgi:hypothetical protein